MGCWLSYDFARAGGIAVWLRGNDEEGVKLDYRITEMKFNTYSAEVGVEPLGGPSEKKWNRGILRSKKNDIRHLVI